MAAAMLVLGLHGLLILLVLALVQQLPIDADEDEHRARLNPSAGALMHPLLHVATPEKRDRRAMVAHLGRRGARKARTQARLLGLSDPRGLYNPPAPRCHRQAFKRVDAAFRAMADVIKTTTPGALRQAAFAQLPVYRSRGKGRSKR